jgi:small subunit ribosomal protein S11e
VDKKCPFTGNVSIRGRIVKGLVISTKMKNTVVVRRDYLRFVSKYRRYVTCASSQP